MSKQTNARWMVASVSSLALAVLVGIMAALIGMGTSSREAAASTLAGVTCPAGLDPASPDYATCQSAIDTLKAYGIEPVLTCLDSAGNDLGCKPINTDDMQLVQATVNDMAADMGLNGSGPQAFKDLLKLGPNEYIRVENRSYNGSSGFTQQPWDFFAIDFDLLHGMLQGPGQAEAWIKNTIAHEMYHVIDGRYDFAYSDTMHGLGYYDTTPQQEDMSNPKPQAGLPVSDHGADGPYDDWAEAGAAEMYDAELDAVYIVNYVAYQPGSPRSDYVQGVWQNGGRPLAQVPAELRQALGPLQVVQAPSNQSQALDADNLPKYPGAQNVAATNRGPNRLNKVYFETPDALATVYAYYDKELQAAGWTEAPRAAGHPRLLFTYPSPGEDQPYNMDLLVIGEPLNGGGSGVSLFTLRWPDAGREIKLPGATDVQVTRGATAKGPVSTLTLTVTTVTTLTVPEVGTYLRGRLADIGWVPDDKTSITVGQGLKAYYARVADDAVVGGTVTVTARELPGGRTEVTLVAEKRELETSTTGSSPAGGTGAASPGAGGAPPRVAKGRRQCRGCRGAVPGAREATWWLICWPRCWR